MRLAVALAAVMASTGSLPHAGRLVPAHSLGGVRLGEPAAQVQTALGRFYGVCKGCSRRTWYFTYGKGNRSGLAVELTRNRVSAVYTIWQPPGWRTPSGIELGVVEEEVTKLSGPVVPIACSGYQALVQDQFGARTIYYIFDGRLWGFGLMAARLSPCR
jgi:hypothetical protein